MNNMFIYNKLTYIARKVWCRAGVTQSVNAHEVDAEVVSSNLRASANNSQFFSLP
jgi:hypothetical protein